MNCPFCRSPGEEILWLNKFPGVAYGCKTTFVGGKIEGERHRKCYEREIARKDAWIERALKFINETADAYYKNDRKYFCNFCSTRKGKGHLPSCPVGQAQALLADMEAE